MKRKHIRQAADGEKQFEEAMRLNMKLGPHSEAHWQAVKHRLKGGRRAS